MKEAVLLRLTKADENMAAAEHNNAEEFYGVAVNRAYYAMYCAVQALFLTKEIHVKTHKGLFTKFSEEYIKTRLPPDSDEPNPMLFTKFSEEYIKTGLPPRDMSAMLASTEDLRIDADYDFENIVTRENAATGLQNATLFIGEIKKCLINMGLLND